MRVHYGDAECVGVGSFVEQEEQREDLLPYLGAAVQSSRVSGGARLLHARS